MPSQHHPSNNDSLPQQTHYDRQSSRPVPDARPSSRLPLFGHRATPSPSSLIAGNPPPLPITATPSVASSMDRVRQRAAFGKAVPPGSFNAPHSTPLSASALQKKDVLGGHSRSGSARSLRSVRSVPKDMWEEEADASEKSKVQRYEEWEKSPLLMKKRSLLRRSVLKVRSVDESSGMYCLVLLTRFNANLTLGMEPSSPSLLSPRLSSSMAKALGTNNSLSGLRSRDSYGALHHTTLDDKSVYSFAGGDDQGELGAPRLRNEQGSVAAVSPASRLASSSSSPLSDLSDLEFINPPAVQESPKEILARVAARKEGVKDDGDARTEEQRGTGQDHSMWPSKKELPTDSKVSPHGLVLTPTRKLYEQAPVTPTNRLSPTSSLRTKSSTVSRIAASQTRPATPAAELLGPSATSPEHKQRLNFLAQLPLQAPLIRSPVGTTICQRPIASYSGIRIEHAIFLVFGSPLCQALTLGLQHIGREPIAAETLFVRMWIGLVTGVAMAVVVHCVMLCVVRMRMALS
ncbi:hypothetical protein BDV95DRAFT_595658 [Massariosphaeria phaeospora]|uniref:Uncharacterized protein n=1 Tax=Massariosphaeria phaeospora TaxID=100035 RepID=A0A7C8M882_9PLEO|nr:hypothetical protein BDV95DRAFT_595658 [Massariosphaeria phaeospora]